MLPRDGFLHRQAQTTLPKGLHHSNMVAIETKGLLLHEEAMEVSITNGTNSPNRGMHHLAVITRTDNTAITVVSPEAEGTIGEEVTIAAEAVEVEEAATNSEEEAMDMEDTNWFITALLWQFGLFCKIKG